MLQRVSHHFPLIDDNEVAYCGHRRRDGEAGSGAPTCPTCTVHVEAEDALDAAIAEMPLPLDAEEAAAVLEEGHR